MKMQEKKKLDTKILATLGLLIGMAVILSRFLSINAWNLKIGFTFVPVFLAAYLYGPVAGAIVGGVADFLGAILFPIGAYFPGFTLSCALTGVVFGCLIHHKMTKVRVICAVCINQLVLGLIVNTLWISILYGAAIWVLLPTRLIQCVLLIPVECVVIFTFAAVIGKVRNAVLHT